MGTTTATVLDERLYRLLQLVNDWLKFAEAKNVGMVGFASGAIAVLLGFLTANNTPLSAIAAVALAGGGLGLVLALLVSLASFLPQTRMERVNSGRRTPGQPDDNLYYFGHIALYEPRALAEELIRRHLRGDVTHVEAGHLELAAQVVINARITIRKLRLFTLSVVCFAVGVVGSGAGVLVVAIQP